MEITQENIKCICGCKTIIWNPKLNGGYPEYYLPITGNGLGARDSRLSVTFNNVLDREYMVWLVVPNSRAAIKHISTVEQFVEQYFYLTGKRPNICSEAGPCQGTKE